MTKPIVSSVCISFLVAVSVVIDCVSLALSIFTYLTLDTGVGEAVIATICNGVTLFVAFFTLFFVTGPAAITCCCKSDDEPNCCTPTYYASIVVALSIAVIGTTVAGVLLIFSISNYEELLSDGDMSSLGRTAAALNFTAAVFGVAVIIIVLGICMTDKGKRHCCSKIGGCAFIFLAILLVSCLVAALLTIFYGLFITDYSEKGGNSENYTRGFWAQVFSGGAAGVLICGMCFGGPVICFFMKDGKDHVTSSLAVSCVWALLTAGTIVAGIFLMVVAGSYSSDESLSSNFQLNRSSVSAMGYLIGALNFATTLAAVFVCFCVCSISVLRSSGRSRSVAVKETPYIQFEQVETFAAVITKT